MSDKKPMFPLHTQVMYPDGSGYSYEKAAMELTKYEYVEPNSNGNLVKFKGGDQLPQAVTIEDVPKDSYTLVLIQSARPKPQQPMIVAPNGAPKK